MLALALLLAVPVDASPKPDRPNVLLIVTDDQSPLTLDCYGDRTVDTPVLDELAESGIVIDDARHMGSWSGAVCLPSRTMIMTGRTVWHIPDRPRGKRSDRPVAVPDPQITREQAVENSLPEVFNRAGYATFRTCKTGNSFAAANARFQTVRDAMRRGPTPESGSVWHADQAIEWLDERQASGDDRPMLVYLGFSHPHDPREASPELAAKYGASNAGPQPGLESSQPLPPSWLPEHPFPIGHPDLRDETVVPGVGTARDKATVRNELAREAACIELIDRQIGRVLDRLRQSSELRHTYVVFISDHGMAVGRHGLMGKQSLYEHTWRVPLIVSGPGIAAGSRAAGGIYLLDLLPTLCELAGFDPPGTVEGQSFASVLRGERDRIREVMFGVYCGGTKPGVRAVKRGRWKLVEWDVLDGSVRRTQLFDLEANPHERLAGHHDGVVPDRQTNLANDPRFASVLAEMRSLLIDQMKQHDDPYELSGL